MQWKSWKAMLDEVRTKVTVEEGCLKEFEDWEDNWVWLCSHLQELGYVKKAKANKSNWEKKTLLHHSGSRAFSYRMEVRRQSKSQVTALIAEVANLRTELASYKSQMSQIVQALSQSGIRFLDLHLPSTSEPFQPEHAHNSAPSTSKPVPNLETFQPPLNDDPVDYAALFS
ncbi:hypothetical protein C1H46_029811 [Malus baccata]|uniref:Uncharacterized protein n=1 Tax=Malus baccata TaxID=106549 RepID=A0A540LE46_MALBA|nr:hypothetical protein C1H46_029811 [Malus baccata]